MDVLSIWLIYIVAFGLGLFTMAFSIGYRSFLPAVVAPSELVEANSKLELAGSGTSALGPAAAGALVQAGNAPFALIFGVFNYVISALLFHRIRVTEHAPKDPPVNGPENGNGNGTENTGGIAEGIRFSEATRYLSQSQARRQRSSSSPRVHVDRASLQSKRPGDHAVAAGRHSFCRKHWLVIWCDSGDKDNQKNKGW